jgi:hypothetical protein
MAVSGAEALPLNLPDAYFEAGGHVPTELRSTLTPITTPFNAWVVLSLIVYL